MAELRIEKGTVIIKDKEYNFIKPTAVDLIEIEDKCIKADGSIDMKLYNESIVKLVSIKLNVEDLVEHIPTEVELSSGETIVLPEIGYDKWLDVLTETGGFSRLKLAKSALASTGVVGEINLSGFKYQDIDGLAMAFFTMYNSDELKRVVDEVTTFCFS